MMRYFYVSFLFVCIAVISVAGLRGSASRRPPLELFSDMTRQPRVRPEMRDKSFSDQFSSRPRPVGTVQAAAPAWEAGTNQPDAFEDLPINTGRVSGATNWVETTPIPITQKFLERGRERFGIFCSACHGETGDGRGITARYNMAGMANFHDKRLIDMTDGEIFNTITQGKNLMGAYGATIPAADRWAIIAYIRALQRSRLANLNDVPEEMRKLFTQ